jgi:hypothetical protein
MDNLDLSSLSKYLFKPGLGFFSHILDLRQAVCKLHEARCDLSNHFHSLRFTVEGTNGRQGSGLQVQYKRSSFLISSFNSIFLVKRCGFVRILMLKKSHFLSLENILLRGKCVGRHFARFDQITLFSVFSFLVKMHFPDLQRKFS